MFTRISTIVEHDEAVDRGLAWFDAAQHPSGELPSFAGFTSESVDSWELDPLNFITALGAIAPDAVPMATAVGVVDRAVAFLRTQRKPGARWRYWSRSSERVAFTRPDADDTACCSMAVALRGDDTRENESILRRLVRQDGVHHTWLIPHEGLISPRLWWKLRDERRPATRALRAQLWSDTEADPDDVDAVVNANVCRYLGAVGR